MDHKSENEQILSDIDNLTNELLLKKT